MNNEIINEISENLNVSRQGVYDILKRKEYKQYLNYLKKVIQYLLLLDIEKKLLAL